MIVCICRRVSDRAIDAAIQAGARDLDDLARAAGAGDDCGCCRPELSARLAARADDTADAAHAGAPCKASPCPGCPRRVPVPSQAA